MEYLSHDVIYHKDSTTGSGLCEKLEDDVLYYLDPFCENEDWIKSTRMRFVMRDYYNLTLVEVWNIINEGDINYQHKCDHPNCNNSTKFINFKVGYQQFCSYSCSASFKWFNPEYADKISRISSENMSKLWEDPEFREFKSKQNAEILSDPYTRYRNQRAKFINNAVSNIGDFYFCILETGDYKFGVCSADLDSYMYYHGAGRGYRIWRSLYKGPIDKVADLEFNIKCILNCDSEFLNKSLLKDFKDAYRKAILLIR